VTAGALLGKVLARARRAAARALAIAMPWALAACAVGPDYQRPTTDIPAAWTAEKPWRTSAPADATERGNWWEVFGDTRLNALEADVVAHNQTLVVAGERLAQARAQASVASAALFPSLNADAGALRDRSSANRPRGSYAIPNSSTVQNDLTAGFAVRYELDLFGGVRRQVEAARAGAEQVRANLANARLVLTAELAADYFSLRALDTEIDVVRRNIVAEKRALDFVNSRHDMGVASGLDLAQQQSQLDTTITQIDLLRVQRAQFEHALATLCGVPAPAFSLAPEIVTLNVPAIPVGVPSDLLERRPDVAAAERAVAAANAQIGVARAAYFPSVPLVGGYGVESNTAASLFNAASNLWSLGVSATQPLFDAGRISANVDFARAGYRATVAQYRESVLTAMQEVEDGMTGIGNLDRASAEAGAAVASAQRVIDLANDRYTGGLATYLDVVTAQQALLGNERQQVQIRGQQMLVAVFLVKALGGGWQNTGAF
jgi:NodT family efflux transporter outer membrane factor (OMF) lipoprotein